MAPPRGKRRWPIPAIGETRPRAVGFQHLIPITEHRGKPRFAAERLV
jgi:hypothetical protein